MEAVRGWAAALCAVAIGCAIMQAFAPKNGLGRIYKLLISAFFICCMAAPLLKLNGLEGLSADLLPQEISGSLLRDRLHAQLDRQMEEALLRVATDTLRNYPVEVQKVDVRTDTLEDGHIYIRHVVLYLDKQSMRYAGQAKEVMQLRLGMDVLVEEAT